MVLKDLRDLRGRPELQAKECKESVAKLDRKETRESQPMCLCRSRRHLLHLLVKPSATIQHFSDLSVRRQHLLFSLRCNRVLVPVSLSSTPTWRGLGLSSTKQSKSG